MTPEWIINEPADVYHAKADKYLSSHHLADFRHCPLLFHKKRTGEIPAIESSGFAVGRAAHALVLEGREKYNSEYIIGGPINPRTKKAFGSGTKAFQEWAETQVKSVISAEDAATIEKMYASVQNHKVASLLFRMGWPEAVVRAEYCGVQCQIRIDYLRPIEQTYGVVDFKTCDDLTWFEYDAKKYGYIHQLAFYRGVLAKYHSFEDVPVYIVAVEKSEPFRCGVWEVPEELLYRAQIENEEAIANLIKCSVDNVWPTGYEELRSFKV